MVGYLVNVLPLRTSLAGVSDFVEVLGRVRTGLAGLSANRHASFTDIVKAVGYDRARGYSPIFQVTLNWRDRDDQLCFIGLDDVDLEPIHFDKGIAKVDLGLVITDLGMGDEIWLEVEYSTELFDPDRIQHLIDQFFALIDAILADPRKPVVGRPLDDARSASLG
jgi:non-ribosomal peptide synthetase component F